ncbi:MAG: acylphosphatase [Patescibacteria group bacterium]
MNKRLKLTIFGQVQRVSFRYNAKTEAIRLGLVGWAKNEDDGTVRILAEGPKEKLNQLLAYCQIGPRLATIDSVQSDWEEGTGEFNNFEIRF